MDQLATAVSRISNLSEDQDKDISAGLKTSLSAGLKAAEKEFKQTKDNKDKQKNEASAYATSARVGQITITGGNLAALIALYKQTSENGSANRFADAVQGLILTSIAVSGVLLLLQVLLANVSPVKNNTGVYWQLMNAYHHRLQLLFYYLCCRFGARPRDDHNDRKTSDGSSYQPVNAKDVELGEQTAAHANGDAKGVTNAPTVSNIESHATNGTNGPAQAGAQGEVEEEKVFESWQQDMNTTITLLGSVLTVLNAVIAGLTGSGGSPAAAPSPA